MVMKVFSHHKEKIGIIIMQKPFIHSAFLFKPLYVNLIAIRHVNEGLSHSYVKVTSVKVSAMLCCSQLQFYKRLSAS